VKSPKLSKWIRIAWCVDEDSVPKPLFHAFQAEFLIVRLVRLYTCLATPRETRKTAPSPPSKWPPWVRAGGVREKRPSGKPGSECDNAGVVAEQSSAYARRWYNRECQIDSW